jgi:hypothetical protein
MADLGRDVGGKVSGEASLTDRCAGCGLVIPRGDAGCQDLFDAESIREYADPRLARRRRLVVDTYSLQHPERYCVSAVSLAAHLTGVCAGVEEPARAQALNATIQRWLSRRPSLDKPALPADRGTLTVADIRDAHDLEAHERAIERWATDTWAAYVDLQPLARTWIREAISAMERARTRPTSSAEPSG